MQGIPINEVDVGYVPPSPLTMHYSLEKGGAEADDITEVLDRFANTARVALKATFDRNKLYYDQKRKENNNENELGHFDEFDRFQQWK